MNGWTKKLIQGRRNIRNLARVKTASFSMACIECDRDDDALFYAHREGEKVPEGAHHISLVSHLTHQAITPDFVHLCSGLDACFL